MQTYTSPITAFSGQIALLPFDPTLAGATFSDPALQSLDPVLGGLSLGTPAADFYEKAPSTTWTHTTLPRGMGTARLFSDPKVIWQSASTLPPDSSSSNIGAPPSAGSGGNNGGNGKKSKRVAVEASSVAKPEDRENTRVEEGSTLRNCSPQITVVDFQKEYFSDDVPIVVFKGQLSGHQIFDRLLTSRNWFNVKQLANKLKRKPSDIIQTLLPHITDRTIRFEDNGQIVKHLFHISILNQHRRF